MSFGDNLIYESIPEYLRRLIENLKLNNIGLIASDYLKENNVQLDDIASGRPFMDYSTQSNSALAVKNVGDRFKISLPFANDRLIWSVVFNSLAHDEPPDFNFNDNYFTRTLDTEQLEKYVPALSQWNHTDPESLSNVIAQLISLFKKCQFDRLKEENNLWCHCLTLFKTELVDETDFEVLFSSGGIIHLLIPYIPDLSDFEIYNASVEEFGVHINTCYNTSSGKFCRPKFRFMPALKDVLPGLESRINERLSGNSLPEIVFNLNEVIVKKLNGRMHLKKLVKGLLKLKPEALRKHYIFQWLVYMGEKIVEFDAEEFKYAYFNLENKGFYFLFCINCPSDFPDSPATYELRSIYLPTPIVVKIEPNEPADTFQDILDNVLENIPSSITCLRKKCIEHFSN